MVKRCLLILLSLIFTVNVSAAQETQLGQEFLLPQEDTNRDLSSAVEFSNFSDYVYIRNSKGVNIAATKARSFPLKSGKYTFATPYAELGTFTIRDGDVLALDAYDYLSDVQFKNISDKAYVYKGSLLPHTKLTTDQNLSNVVHTLYAGNEKIQLPFGNYKIFVGEFYRNSNIEKINVSRNKKTDFDFKDHFGYLDIPNKYRDGKILSIGNNFNNKCCTVIPGVYTVIIDKQNLGTFEVNAGQTYTIDPNSEMGTLSITGVKKQTRGMFKLEVGNLGVPKNSQINLKPGSVPIYYTSFNQVERKHFKKKIGQALIKKSEHTNFIASEHLGNLELINLPKKRFFKLKEQNSESSIIEVHAGQNYLPEGVYQIERNGLVIPNIRLSKNEITTLDMQTYLGTLKIVNSDRRSIDIYNAITDTYIDAIRLNKRNDSIQLIAGSYHLRERKNANNGSLGTIIASFSIKADETNILDFSEIETN